MLMNWSDTDGRHDGDTRARLGVLVAAKSRLVAEMLTLSIETAPQLDAVGYTLNGWEALDAIEALRPDAVVVGPSLTGLDPLGFCQFTHELYPNVLLILLCERLVPAAVESAYALGVADCVPMSRSIDELVRAVCDAETRKRAFDRGSRRSTGRGLFLVPSLGDADARV
jgi:DNA-binding NarL/FixJ family response regulator